jgi:hypothetical protein
MCFSGAVSWRQTLTDILETVSHMPLKTTQLAFAATFPLLLTSTLTPAAAGEITGFDGAFGDGIIYIDTTENVTPPGIQSITGALNNDDFTSANGFSPSGVVNCLMASNDNVCDSPPGTGKRYKSWLQGPDGFDLRFLTAPSGGVTEYFNFGKVTNFSGARVAGFSFILGTGTGADFAPVAAGGADGVSFDNLVAATAKAGEWPTVTAGDLDQNPLQRFFFPGGLFGDGGQEGVTGFFSADDAGFEVVPDADLILLDTGVFFNAEHLALFGDGLLDRTRLPEGLFWDDDGDPNTEALLVAWYNTGAGEWQYGNVADDPGTAGVDEAAEFLQALADALGVTVPDLAHTGSQGAPVPAQIVALIEGNAAFEEAGIEDISNLNLNFSFDVGDIALGEFTLRIAPIFFPIVNAAGTDYQFGVAAALDGANITYLAADPAYQTVISDILALPTAAEQQQALERLGYSFLAAHGNLEYEMARQTVDNILFGSGLATGASFLSAGTERLSTSNGADSMGEAAARWSLPNGLEGFLAMSGTLGTVGNTTNSIGYNFRDYGATAGVSMGFGDMFEAGLAVSYGTAQATINDNRGSLAARNYGVAIFGKGRFDSGLNVSGVAGYQFGSIDSTRNINAASVSATALGTNRASDLFAALSADWMFDMGALSIGPSASAEYHHVSTQGFTETGAGLFNVTMDGFTTDLFTGTLAVKGEYGIPAGAGDVTLFGHAGYTVMRGSDLAVPFRFGPVLTGTTVADGLSGGYFDVGAGVKANLGDMASIGVEYRGALSGGYQSHTIRGGVQISF